MPAAKAAARVAESLAYPLALSDVDKRALATVILEDEFQGLAAGTALAAMLRSAGLALTPERPQGGDLHYQVGAAQAGRESWPVGRGPSGKTNEKFPELFEFLNVEIQDIPVSEALEAIALRLKVPFIYDRNAMSLYDIDPSKSQADVPSKRMTYSLILKRVLSQAKMKFDPRVDDADKPFLWITTIKPVK